VRLPRPPSRTPHSQATASPGNRVVQASPAFVLPYAPVMVVSSLARQCPECGESLPAVQNFRAWCPACEWGVAEPEKERSGFFRSRADRWSARQVTTMFQQLSGSVVTRPGWGTARLLSYLLAIFVHACSLALFGVGIWLLVAMPNVVTVILAAVALLLAFELRPRLGSFRKLKNARFSGDAPALFSMLDQVAAEVGAKPAHAFVIDASWSATYQAVGWRRRRIVTFGLPLWDSLPEDQRLAMLGHEFAHGVNGDALHGTVVSTSVTTLVRLYRVLHPGRLDISDPVPAIELLVRVVLSLPRGIVVGVLMAQQLIALRARQRAEYLADVVAARVASPASAANALDTLVTGQDTYAFVFERRRFRAKDGNVWDELRSELAAVPETERERRRRAEARKRLRVTVTHPPAHLRIKMMAGLPSSDSAVTLPAGQHERIQAELAADYVRIGRLIDESAADGLPMPRRSG
jgi:Zn-dependent protease with chaperone function